MPNLVIYIPKDLERRLQEAREDWKEHARVVAVEALREAAVTERGQRLPLAQRDGAQGNPASSVQSPRSVTPARTQMCEHRIPATHFCKRCD